MSAVDLEVTIRPAGSAYRVEARCTAPDTDAPTDAAATIQIDRLRLDALTLDSAAYGLALGEMVLAGLIGAILGTARAVAEREGVPLRLRLALDPDVDALHTLRWETLRDPARPDQPLLTTGAQVVFSRYLSSSAWQPVWVPPLEELRALVVLSSPLDLADFGLSPLDLETERTLVTASFGQIPVTVLGRGAANLDTIVQHLGDGHDILYLLAHGRADENGETWVFLEDADGLTAPTQGSALATRIAELERRPRLVLLGSCETAGALLALGPRLAQVGVPAVVGMQDKITVATLRRFLPECLKVLQRDGRIDLAVAQARGLVRGQADFWMPVLFLRLLSGRLWEMAGTTPERPLMPEELLASLPLDDTPEPQTLPTPHRMPLRPNPLFVGRDDELRTLARLLGEGGTVAITTGIGGMGKTQLAVELVHRYGAFFAGGVFWVSCADPAGISGEVAACGLAGLVMRPDYAELKQDDQVRVVYAVWQEAIPRLLIFDNCEEEQTLRQWLPTTGGARVLVTSRRANWSTTLKVQPVPLRALPRGASVALLQQLAPRLSSEEAQQIAEALGDLPLALHLAGCYLARYCLPVTGYVGKLRGVQFQHPSMTGRGVEDMPTQREPHVERVFALSLARLDVSKPIDDLARRLLARAACFAPGEPFRRVWLEQTITPEGDEEEQMLARTDVVERLLELGLVEQLDEKTLRLHRLLAAYATQALADGAALSAVEEIIDNEASGANSTGLPAAMLPVLPHLRHLVQQTDLREDTQVARLLDALGNYLKIVGNYAEARPLLERALNIAEQVLGGNYPDTVGILNNLASLLETQGDYGEARLLYERALAISERVLGADHPDTVGILNNLGLRLWEQGAYREARLLFERMVAIIEQVLDADHSNTATSLNKLAFLLRAQGIYGDARPLYDRGLVIREQILGTDHPHTAQNLHNLAGLVETQGAYGDGRPLLERALAIRERVLGADHPLTASSLNNLAGLLDAQGDYGEARLLYKRALAISERVLGADHPDTASSLNDLARMLEIQGDYEEARLLYERALATYERVLGADHPFTASSLNNLAGLLETQRAYGDACPLLERALHIAEQALGANHPLTASSLNNLASLLNAQGAYNEARLLLERALAIRERVLGGNHPLTAGSLNNLACVHQAQQAYGEAHSYYHRALTIYTHVLGPNHSTTRVCRANRRICLADAQLGPLPSANNAQRDQMLFQVHAATDAALAEPVADRHALATAIEARARWAEDRDLPWQACAQELRALIVQLGVTPDDPDAL
jgi:tetratricopeptide (TPR) repeat protein